MIEFTVMSSNHICVYAMMAVHLTVFSV